jgi:Zn-dependent protease with chaperone function
VVQVIGQATLASLLSFWVTALWMHSYSLKFIGLISIAALIGVLALIRAVFAKLPAHQEIQGSLVTEGEASALWSRIRQVANGMGTAPPDRIIAGIDANFFVTQSPVLFQGAPLGGRTLYVSLPLLKTMSVAEADAVLGHEMAHFSGEDTEFSLKIAPLIQRWHHYLVMLGDGITLPVFHFMNVFRCLYLKVLGDHSRSREFRADRLGADLTSPAAMVRALVKVAAYSRWRATTEHGLLSKNERTENLHLREKIETGFPAAFQTFVSSDDALNSQTPHPFDSHPPMNQRMTHFGIDPAAALKDPALLTPPADSWYSAIGDAVKKEEDLWTSHQNQIESLHNELLAFRLMPDNAAEEALLVQAFPPLAFTHGKKTATLTCDRLTLSSCDLPVFFGDISEWRLDPGVPSTTLILIVTNHTVKKRVVKLCPKQFLGPSGNLLDAFKKYYGRHLAAVAYRDQQAAHGPLHGTPAGHPQEQPV